MVFDKDDAIEDESVTSVSKNTKLFGNSEARLLPFSAFMSHIAILLFNECR